MTALGLVLVALILSACGIRGMVPEDADHPLMWIVGLSAAACLLSGAAFLGRGAMRRMERRWERRIDRQDEP